MDSGNWQRWKIATGWQTWDNNRYYLNADGTMKANESFTDGGKTYFFCSWGGAYKNCWQTWNGKNITCMITVQPIRMSG